MVAAVAGLVLGASACGGGKKSTDTTTGSSATEAWASGVCTAFTDWKTSLENIKSNLTGGGLSGLTEFQLRQSGRQAQDATKTLTKSLDDLGAPTTTGGEAAKSKLDALKTTLSDSMSTIEDTLRSNPSSLPEAVAAVAAVKAQLTTMATALTGTVGDLKQLDPSGDLEKAFHRAPSCSAYF